MNVNGEGQEEKIENSVCESLLLRTAILNDFSGHLYGWTAKKRAGLSFAGYNFIVESSSSPYLCFGPRLRILYGLSVYRLAVMGIDF
jgi:hypothetical protein